MASRKENQHGSNTSTPDEYARIAQDYELPKAVKCKLEADIVQAQSIAIVITLLAGALVTLTAIIGGVDSATEGTTAWRGFRIILWSAIMFDIGEAFVCIMAIKMCCELPLLAMEKQMLRLEEAGASQNHVESARENAMGLKALRDRHLLLESVGMPPLYRLVDHLVLWNLVLSSALSFVTIFFWVIQTHTLVTSMLTVIAFVMVVVMVVTVFVIAMGYGRGRQ